MVSVDYLHDKVRDLQIVTENQIKDAEDIKQKLQNLEKGFLNLEIRLSDKIIQNVIKEFDKKYGKLLEGHTESFLKDFMFNLGKEVKQKIEKMNEDLAEIEKRRVHDKRFVYEVAATFSEKQSMLQKDMRALIFRFCDKEERQEMREEARKSGKIEYQKIMDIINRKKPMRDSLD